MTATRDPQSVIAAAEQAAAAGDYASAEQLLREAAHLQEASGGPLDPDLANTLNNLAIVCEITEKPADAEHFFRRANAIATAVLEPDHPFVATSRKNLEDFCAARGIPIEPPIAGTALNADDREASFIAAVQKAPPTADDREGPPIAGDQEAPAKRAGPVSPEPIPPEPVQHFPPAPVPYEESRPVVPARWSRPIVVGALVAGVLLLVLIATLMRFRSGTTVEQTSQAGPTATPALPAATPAVPPTVPADTGAPKEAGAAAKVERGSSAPSAEQPTVVTAQLCRELSTDGAWRCVPPSLPVDGGRLFYYTRVKSPVATSVEHRWYLNDRLRRVVERRIRANATDGYRTYSRSPVGNDAGDWKVELRTKDGVLLHEERFVVR
jgi:Protein of unknown function (DUF2914)/Tetratricopeptide repeat